MAAEGPLHQFTVAPLNNTVIIGGYDISFTNASFWMLAAVGLVYWFVIAGTRRRSIIPGRFQNLVELSYDFVASIVRDNAGNEGMRFFPLIFTLFMFILAGNMLGMLPLPGHFTFTSHIIVTFTMALCVFIAVTILGFAIHGWRFAKFFVPEGAPAYMLPIIVPIEIISYCVRPISLSVRLFVNMMAGHTMMAVFVGFVIALGVFGVLPLVVAVALTGFEFAVAFLQAYIFTVLTCLYLNDAIHMH